jgi:hypothetical protein
MPDKKNEPCTHGDEMVVGPSMVDGKRCYVRHTSNHEIQVGIVSPTSEGAPVGDNVVVLERQGDGPVYSVRPLFEERRTSGPAKVTTPAYRKGWETIFGARVPIAEA